MLTQEFQSAQLKSLWLNWNLTACFGKFLVILSYFCNMEAWDKIKLTKFSKVWNKAKRFGIFFWKYFLLE